MNETFWSSELSYSGIQSYRLAEMKNQSTESIEFCLKKKSQEPKQPKIEMDKFP